MSTLLMLDPKEVVAETNIRSDLGDMAGLEASIKRTGVLVPVLVRRDNGGAYHLIAGFRRRAAAESIGVKLPAYEITDYEWDTATEVEAQYAENVWREDLSTLDKAQAMLELSDTGMTQRDVAKATGVSQRSMKGWIALAKAEVTDAGDIHEDALLELASEVPTEDVAPTIAEYLKPTTGMGHHSLERAYEYTVAAAKEQAAMVKINEAIEKLEAEGIEVLRQSDLPEDQYGSKQFRGWKITDAGAKNADEILNRGFGHDIVLDVKAHRGEDCHIYYLAPGGYNSPPTLGEYCIKPKRHEKTNANVQVPDAAGIEKAQTKARAVRKAERDERAELASEVGDWLRDTKLKAAETTDVLTIAALKTRPHDWQKDVARLLELETDNGDAEYTDDGRSDKWTRALDAYLEGKSEAWIAAFNVRVLVAIDVMGNRRYGYEGSLSRWYTEHTD